MKNVNGWSVPAFDSVISKGCQKFPESDYQQYILDWALSNVKSFDLAVDVGANVGLHSVRFAQKFSQVESFEPFSINFECLEKNVSPFKNINLHKKGLGSKLFVADLMLPKDSTNSGAPSLVDFVTTDRERHQEKIQIVRLDDFNFRPNLIKIDTQGYEMEVLKGAVITLQSAYPVLIIECAKKPFVDISNFLASYGYVLGGITNKDKVFYVPEENSA